MTISRTQPMRPAEIDLLNHMDSAEGDITQLQEDLEETNQELGQEVVNRQQADTALGTRIDDETLARTQADTALGNRIDDETLARTQVDTALGNRLDTEEDDISTLQTNVATAQSDISTLQTNVATAQSDISTLQTNVANSTTLETIDYIDYISPSNNVTISSAVLNRIGRICMLHVEFNLATEMNPLTQRNIFDIVGSYKPLTGCPASINGAGACAIINSTGTLWIKTFNTTYSGGHYMDCIYIHQ